MTVLQQFTDFRLIDYSQTEGIFNRIFEAKMQKKNAKKNNSLSGCTTFLVMTPDQIYTKNAPFSSITLWHFQGEFIIPHLVKANWSYSFLQTDFRTGLDYTAVVIECSQLSAPKRIFNYAIIISQDFVLNIQMNNNY